MSSRTVHEKPFSEMENDMMREIEEFKREKERIRNILGNIGGTVSTKKERLINAGFLLFVLIFFTLEVTTHFLPPFVSLEIGLLMLSIKIIWMMNSSHKVSHFQFWILNSIEYKLNQVDKRFRILEKQAFVENQIRE